MFENNFLRGTMLLLDSWNKKNKQIDLWQKDQHTFHIINFLFCLHNMCIYHTNTKPIQFYAHNKLFIILDWIAGIIKYL